LRRSHRPRRDHPGIDGGIDFPPAAVRHARTVVGAEGLDCTFDRANLPQADMGLGHALVLLLFGQRVPSVDALERLEGRGFVSSRFR
jgi:hypothetical protein